MSIMGPSGSGKIYSTSYPRVFCLIIREGEYHFNDKRYEEHTR